MKKKLRGLSRVLLALILVFTMLAHPFGAFAMETAKNSGAPENAAQREAGLQEDQDLTAPSDGEAEDETADPELTPADAEPTEDEAQEEFDPAAPAEEGEAEDETADPELTPIDTEPTEDEAQEELDPAAPAGEGEAESEPAPEEAEATEDSSQEEPDLNVSSDNRQGENYAAAVEQDGNVTYFDSFSTAADGANWVAGSTLKLYSDVITTSPITVPSGEHTLDLNGCGILMTGNDRVITINQGASLELNDSDPDRIHYITLTNYRGTAVSDSGEESVSNGNGVIKVTGGYLTGGYRNNSGYHDKCGACVFNWGTFVMNGGSIVGNTMYNNSGGAIRNSGYFTMNGGTIAFNYSAGGGAGVTTYVPGGGQGKMLMTGGVISDNYTPSVGGGLVLAGPFEMTGGSVVRNTADAGGSGVYYGGQGDRFKLSGNPVIKDNINDDLYMDTNATFMISGTLSEGADVRVLMKNPAAFTVGWKANMGNADPSKYFTSDNDSYQVFLNDNGEAEIGVPPAASVISGDTTTSYAAFSDAVNAWAAGSTLKLLTDVATSSTIVVPSGAHTLDLNGCGIKMTGWGSVFYVGDGAKLIIDDSDTDTTHKFDVPNGAGLASLNEAGGNYTVNGGYITGGNAENGGGIYIGEYGEVFMNGGTLIGSHADDMGAGVRIESNTFFTLNGGEIAYNQSSVHGGGICAAYTNHTVITVNGGAIHHNLCQYSGGAITLDSDPDSYLYLYGGEIRDNASVSGSGNNPWHPGGIAGNGNIHIKGGVQVWNNINLSSSNNGTEQHNIEINTSENDLITLDGPLSKGARIAVSYHTGGNKTTGVFTSGWSKYMGDADPADYFASDYDDYIVIINNGEAEIINRPAATVTSGGNTAYYADISSALSAWTVGSTLKLMADVTTSSTVSVPSGKHTLDLNGHALKAGSTGYSVVTVGSGAELVIDDTSENTGKITGGSVGQNSGGGVTVDGGTLTLKGGAISGNANTYGGIGNCGGGVHVRNGGKFYMEGGEISGNTSYVGGGVCADSSATTVSITGGVIKNNVTERFGSAIWAGRNGSAIFRIGGTAQIIDNISKWTSDKDGEGTLNTGSTYLLSGDPTVHGDWKTNGTSSPNTHINLDNDGSGIQRIELEGALTNSTGTPKLTVTPLYRWNDLKNGQTFVFTKNWSSYMGTAHPADYFKVDDSVSGVRVIRKDGEAAVTGGSDLGDLYITFDANGGSGTMEPQLATGTSAALNQNAFTRGDYEFTGWNTKQDGSGTGYEDKASVTLTGDLTLYAQWKEEPSQFEGKGTDEQPYLIQSADDWDTLSSYINSGGTRYAGKCFQLTNDISVTTVLGNRPNTGTDSNDNVFSGTFDGGGHTLTVSINDPVFAAPFAIAHNATIKNLNVTGTVTSTGNHATGLVGASKGRSINDASTLVIQNVTVSVSVSCNSHVAGIVGHAHKASITMENVVFDGSLNASSVQGGFIGWGGVTGGTGFSASFKDCLFAGSYRSGAAFYPVAFASGQGTATLVNDFYTTSLGSGGSPIATTGDGQVRLLAVTVEKDGKVRYFDNIGTAAASENWVAGSTLRLMDNVSNSVTITVPAGEHTLDLNGYTLTQLSTVGKLLVGGGASSVSGLTIIDQTGYGVIKHEVSRPGSLIWVKEGSSLTLNGGTLEANSSASPVIDFFQQKNASFTMNGGKITGIANSGAVRLSTNCSFTVTGGEISGLQTASGLIDYSADSGSVIALSGNPVITNNTANGQTVNLNVPDGKTLTISGALTDGASVGITTQSIPGGFTSGWSTYMGSADPSQYFTSDNSSYSVFLNNNGEAEIGTPPVASIIIGETATDYSAFPDAVNAWLNASDGATLKLLDDVSYTDKIILTNGKTRILDLNGKTFTRTVPSGDGTVFDVNSGANFTLTDTSEEQTGVVTRQSGNYGGTVLFVRDSGSVINFNGGTLTGFTSRVVITWQGSTVNMSGGEISGNNLNNGDATDGIVRTYSSTSEPGGTFNMTGGRIVNNTLGSGKTGGAVYVGNNGTFRLSGDAEISGNTQNGSARNVYLPAGATIALAGALADGVRVSITLQNGSGEVTSGWKTYMGSADPAKYFASDNADYEVRLEDGEAILSYPYVSGVSAEGFSGDYDGKAHSITVTVPNGATVKYGTTEGDYSLTECPAYTDAGTYTVYYQATQDKHLPVAGSATVQIDPINATVTVTGKAALTDYDGEFHTVSGYDAVASTPLYDVTKDFTFSGKAEAVRANAGTAYMGLAPEQFANTNRNFAEVTFDVTDGYVTVNPINVTVTITGHNDTVDYDGKSHSVEGYDAVASSELYDVTKDFTFSGWAKATRTNAGKTDMGLNASQFKNTNANFATVTFNVTDGYIMIGPIDAIVTITGHTGTFDYDGELHTVEGYDVSCDNPLYLESDFSFSGTAKAETTNAGTVTMGLAAKQFKNTNDNFTTVVFFVTDGSVTVEPIDATVTVTGHNGTVDYDGKAHSVEGYDVSASTELYDVTKDFTFSGSATAERTEAGTTEMGLSAGQFENTNSNFANVTFNVTDGFVTVNPINVTVTITGHTDTVNYDGKAHVVEGYDVAFSDPLYTEADFAFSSAAMAQRANAGTTKMGLAAEQFANINNNFGTVIFRVTDGYLTVKPVNAVITTQPQAKSGLICNDMEQELILAGSATGGTLYYAIGESAGAAPANDQYTTKLPVGKDTGIYYIWYRVKADANHNDLPPVCLKVTMAGEDWVTVNGGIVDEDGNPVSEATVSLILGGSVVDETVTGSDGAYSFTVPEGVYNVVVVCEDATVTDLVDAAESTPYLVTVPDSDTDSVLDVAGTDSNIVVGGLSDEASRIRELEEVPNDQNVTVKMTVTTVTESETAYAAAIGESDPDKNFLFYDLKLEKTVDAVTTNLAATQTVLEIVIPCAFTDKSEFCVYSSGAGIQALTESDSRAAGTYRVDHERGVVYVYTNSITTYAVGYKPYYSVTGNVSLGSYTGTVSVTLTRDGTDETYVLDNVTLENISFTGIPKGTYSMTVTWTDGVENTITTPFTIKEMTGGPNNE